MQKITGSKKTSTASSSPRPTTKPIPRGQQADVSSTHSWSPPIDVFSKPPEPQEQLEVTNTMNESPPIVNHQEHNELLVKYKGKAKEYKALENWMDRRLSIFEQLQKDLNTAAGNHAATERITNRVAVETANLKADKEYKWKMAEMDQLREEIGSLRTQMDA